MIKTKDPERDLVAAIEWLKGRNKYVLSNPKFKPGWGIPSTVSKPGSSNRSIEDRKSVVPIDS